MLSRVANSIYWLGRYLERAENYARLIEVNFNLMMDLPPGLKEQWEPVVRITGDLDSYAARYDGFDQKQVIYYMAFDPENPNAITSSIKAARENARGIRENLTKETWEYLNDLYLYMTQRYEHKDWLLDDPREMFESIRKRILLLYGLAFNTGARTESWYFRQMGMYLERADKTSRFLDMKYHLLLPSPDMVGNPLDVLQWTALLKSVSGYNAYRRLYGAVEPVSVVDFLVLNRRFSRSIFYCLKEAEGCLNMISGNLQSGFGNTAEKALGTLRSRLEYADVRDVINQGLHEYLDDLQLELIRVSDHINVTYFQLGRMEGTY